jgi:hypothetical protein
MTERATVDRLTDAKVGDRIWVFDSQENRYEGREYKGRGCCDD